MLSCDQLITVVCVSRQIVSIKLVKLLENARQEYWLRVKFAPHCGYLLNIIGIFLTIIKGKYPRFNWT